MIVSIFAPKACKDIGEQSSSPVEKAAAKAAFTPERGSEAMIQDTMGRRRPLGITIIAIIVAIYGILSIIGGIALLGASATAAIIAIVIGVLQLILAWGLWTLQRWAFWATVVIEALAVINGILALTGNSTVGRAPGIIGIIIALIVLIYLFADRNVRAAFRT